MVAIQYSIQIQCRNISGHDPAKKSHQASIFVKRSADWDGSDGQTAAYWEPSSLMGPGRVWHSPLLYSKKYVHLCFSVILEMALWLPILVKVPVRHGCLVREYMITIYVCVCAYHVTCCFPQNWHNENLQDNVCIQICGVCTQYIIHSRS